MGLPYIILGNLFAAHMTQLVRSQVLTGYATLARAFGLAPELLAQAVGLDLRALADLDARISARAFADLLERSAQSAKSEDFGIRLAESRGLGILGPVGILMREEPDLRAALRSLSRYLPVHNEALGLELTEDRGVAVLSLEVTLPGAITTRQFAELSLGAFFRIVSRLIGHQWTPSRVCFRHAAAGDTATHRRLFGCRVEFEHDFHGIVFPARELDTPISMSDRMLAQYAHRYLNAIVRHRDASPAEKVRELVKLWLPSGNCTADKVARGLGVDRRSVHRYLAHQGETFTSVVTEVRADLACQLLQGHRPLSEIAELVGFSGAAAFSRWFKQAFRCSPTQWREMPAEARPSYTREKR